MKIGLCRTNRDEAPACHSEERSDEESAVAKEDRKQTPLLLEALERSAHAGSAAFIADSALAIPEGDA